ncbi:porin family protein [Kordia sp.]|uniref:porin family protein n=1 Tax=Kordia sp. TaxID=1965332 RepID=UPI003D26FA26
MKKIVLITVMTVFGFATMNAQDVEFGAKLGANFGSLYGNNTGSIDPILSVINFGFYSEIPLNEKFSFQPEIMYSIQGFSVDDKITRLNYLNLPLMGKYYLTKKLSVEAGPQVGFLVSAKGPTGNVKGNFKTLDVGVNFGVGYKLNNGLNFGARYNLGLSNINDMNGSSDKLRNGVLQVTVGYSFF